MVRLWANGYQSLADYLYHVIEDCLFLILLLSKTNEALLFEKVKASKGLIDIKLVVKLI